MMHGSRATYQRGCRCLPCRAANAAYRPTTPVAAHAARAHLVELEARGLGTRRIAALSGLARATVQAVRAGAVEQIHAETADRLLAIRPVLAAGALVASWPCRRLLNELRREGFTADELHARYQVPPRTRPGRKVRASTAARVFAVYRLVTAGEVDSSSTDVALHP